MRRLGVARDGLKIDRVLFLEGTTGTRWVMIGRASRNEVKTVLRDDGLSRHLKSVLLRISTSLVFTHKIHARDRIHFFIFFNLSKKLKDRKAFAQLQLLQNPFDLAARLPRTPFRENVIQINPKLASTRVSSLITSEIASVRGHNSSVAFTLDSPWISPL